MIRHEEELAAFRDYIETNPLRWALDRENPERQRSEAGPVGTGPYSLDGVDGGPKV